ncbi:hypothetical protein [uncultured Aquimarina sp.]|uniref:hypothetical protein n=1 Tax=uncultured Aquimarina sp. TaxID=575652 RepID=UPI00260ADA8F|nr:hypothetical protein [uncultured Aquimarina sp.]
MDHKIQPLIDTFRKKPRLLFLVDGLGALLTIFFLAVVLTTFQEYIGMPKKILYFLSLIVLVFAIYSLSCYLLNPTNWKIFLKIIAFANLIYCLLTAAYMYYFYESLTNLGLLYFCIEILIIFLIVTIEFMIASAPKNK